MFHDSQRSGLIIALIALAIYAGIPTRNFYWDGVGFAQAIESGGTAPNLLLNPNHLIYNLVGYLLWKALAAAGMAVRALFVLQAMNALFAAAGVFLVWDSLRKLTGSLSHALWGSLLFAFSAQWWKFASDADAYIPSIVFMLASFRWLATASRPRYVSAAIAHSVAMLFHQLAFFFYPVALIGLLARREPGACKRKKPILEIAGYGGITVALTGGAYILAYGFVRPYLGAGRFIDWITVFSADASLPIAIYHRFRYSIRGTLRLFFGGRINQVSPDAVVVAGVTLSAIILAVLWILIMRSRFSREARAPGHASPYRAWLTANRVNICWILVYLIFLFFWLPQNVFYRMFYLPPLMCALVSLPLWRAHRVRVIALLAALVCAWNFNVLIYPHSRTATNEVLSFALRNQNEWRAGTVIIYSRSHTDLWLIKYFNPQAEWIECSSADIKDIESQRLKATRSSRPAWLEGMAYDVLGATAEGREWLARHIDEPSSLHHITPAHNIRYYQVR